MSETTAARPAPRLPAALRGALWMVGALLSFTVMAVAVRELLPSVAPFQILFWRATMCVLILLPIVAYFGAHHLRTRRPGLHAARGLMHLCGQYAWVHAIGFLPLATVFAIEFTMPVWTVLLALVVLGERLNRARAVMLVLGLAGILVILRPGVGPVPPAALVMLAGSFAYAATLIATKQLARTDSMLSILFYMSLVQVPVALAPALQGWTWPAPLDWPWIAAMGVTGVTAHFCMTRAFRLADATLVVPIDFLRLPLIAVIGMAFYDEALDPRVLAGAALMFAGTYYCIRRESRVG